MLREVLLKCKFEERVDHLLLGFSCFLIEVFFGLVEDEIYVLYCYTFVWLFVDVALAQCFLELFGTLVYVIQHLHAC